MSRVVRLLASVAGLLLLLPLLGVVATNAAQAGAAVPPTLQRVQIAPRAPSGATNLGAVAATSEISGDVVLEPRDPAALQKFIAQVTDKSSAEYHQYLTRGAFGAAFGPTSSTISAVEQQLEAGGLRVTGVASDGVVVRFAGTATKVESTFHTALDRYKLSDGSSGMATTSAVLLPSSIASSVVAVMGLDNLVHAQPAGLLRAPRSKVGTYPAATSHTFTHPAGSPTACTTAGSTAKTFGGLTDDEIAHAYGAFGLYKTSDFGATQTIAVYELGGFTRGQVHTFDSCYFGSVKSSAMTTRLLTETRTSSLFGIDGGQPHGSTIESSLDVEDLSALAPTANIDVYQAPNTTVGGLDEYSAIVNQDTAQVVSTSWGLCEQALQTGEPGLQQAENVLFEQAAAQGQSIFAAAGDEGSDDCNTYETSSPVTPVLSVDDPGSQPYVVSVGGTTISDASQPPAEHVWNDGALWGAGGGGISQSWPITAWQLDSGVPGVDSASIVTRAETFMTGGFCLTATNAGGTVPACREVPDVSAQADEFTGAITMYTTTATPTSTGWFTIGGTSSATPIWAGLLALVNDSHDSSVCRPSVHGGVGFVSPLLYGLASSPASYAQSFSDVKTGNNDPYGDSHLFPATTGYDMASGLGSPKLTNTTGTSVGLAYDLCNLATPTAVHAPTPDVTVVTPPYGPTNHAGATAQIFGKNFCTATVSKVKSVQVGNFILPGADVHSVTCTTTPQAITVTLPASTKLVPPGDTTDGAGAYEVVVSLTDGISSHAGSTTSFTYVDENATTPPGAVPDVTSVRAPAGTFTGGNTVDIFGTGFSTATAVTFGGAAATFTVKSPYEIVAQAPSLSGGTTCAITETRGQICQVTVVVTGPGGTSSTGSTSQCRGSGTTGEDAILPPIHGRLTFTPLGVATTPSGEEAAPQPCEYDYIARPEIHTISTSAGPASFASERGGTVVTIRGQGFSLFGLDWVSIGFGTGRLAATQDFTLLSVTNTKIQLVARPITNTGTTGTLTVPIRVKTLSGTSHTYSADDLQYAGVPSVTSVHSSLVSAALDASTAPATAPTSLTITGATFDDVYAVEFADVFQTFGVPFSFGTQYTFTTRTTTSIETTTVQQSPGVVYVSACTVTGCYTPYGRTATTPAKITYTTINETALLYLFPPGAPVVDSISPTSGYAAGGTTVTITGENLGCVYKVTIAGVVARSAQNTFSLLDCGTTTSVKVVTAAAPTRTPPHGPVKAYTIESTVTGTAPVSHATFTYLATPPPPSSGAAPPSSLSPPAPPEGSRTSKSGTWSTSGTHTVSDTPIGVKVTSKGAGAFTVAGYSGAPKGTTTAEGGTGTYVDVAIATQSTFTSLTIRVCPSTASTGLVWWTGTAWVPFSDATVQSTGCITATVTATSSPSLKDLTGTPIAAVKYTASRIAGATADATAAAELERSYSAQTAATDPQNCVGGTAGTTPTATRTVVLATDQHFQDALSSQYLAGALHTGTLLTPFGQLSPATIAALKLEGITNVDVVGGPFAVSTPVVNQLENTPAYSCGGTEELQKNGRVRTIKATRIFGASAYDTAEKVADTFASTDVGKAAFPAAYGSYNDTTGISSAAPAGTTPLSTAILADGQEFQDAEAASVMSYADHFPILLTAPEALSTQAAAALKNLTIHQVIVLGGPAAVSNAVVTSLEQLGLYVLRIAGTTASDTAAKLATFEVTGSSAGLGWTPAGGALVATSSGYTDGLAGAALEAHYGAYPEPLLLTGGSSAAGTALTSFLRTAGKPTGVNGTHRSIFKLHVLGGSLAVTTALVAQMVTDLAH